MWWIVVALLAAAAAGLAVASFRRETASSATLDARAAEYLTGAFAVAAVTLSSPLQTRLSEARPPEAGRHGSDAPTLLVVPRGGSAVSGRPGCPAAAQCRPTQQRAGAPGGAPGLLLCQEAGLPPALPVVVQRRSPVSANVTLAPLLGH